MFEATDPMSVASVVLVRTIKCGRKTTKPQINVNGECSRCFGARITEISVAGTPTKNLEGMKERSD
jgi:hypothetical protein